MEQRLTIKVKFACKVPTSHLFIIERTFNNKILPTMNGDPCAELLWLIISTTFLIAHPLLTRVRAMGRIHSFSWWRTTKPLQECRGRVRWARSPGIRQLSSKCCPYTRSRRSMGRRHSGKREGSFMRRFLWGSTLNGCSLTWIAFQRCTRPCCRRAPRPGMCDTRMTRWYESDTLT